MPQQKKAAPQDSTVDRQRHTQMYLDPMSGRYREAIGKNETTGQPIFKRTLAEDDSIMARQQRRVNRAGR